MHQNFVNILKKYLLSFKETVKNNENIQIRKSQYLKINPKTV